MSQQINLPDRLRTDARAQLRDAVRDHRRRVVETDTHTTTLACPKCGRLDRFISSVLTEQTIMNWQDRHAHDGRDAGLWVVVTAIVLAVLYVLFG